MEKLKRQVFELSRALEFFTEKELTMQIGHELAFWYVGLIKELIDNALDACETTTISPAIKVTVSDEFFEIADNGPGLPHRTLQKSLDFLTRVSDKQFYVSPTRGQMGNALKTIWAAPYVASGSREGGDSVARETDNRHHGIEQDLAAAGNQRRVHRR